MLYQIYLAALIWYKFCSLQCVHDDLLISPSHAAHSGHGVRRRFLHPLEPAQLGRCARVWNELLSQRARRRTRPLPQADAPVQTTPTLSESSPPGTSHSLGCALPTPFLHNPQESSDSQWVAIPTPSQTGPVASAITGTALLV
jgi:hypothetical protein